MKIKTGHTSSTLDAVISAEIQSLVFKYTPTTPAAAPDFSTLLSALKITVVHVADGSANRLYTSVPADVLAEVDARDEGVVEIGGTSSAATDITFAVPISPAGALVLGDDDQLQLSVTGIDGTLDVYGLEFPTRDVMVTKAKKLVVSTDVLEKTFSLEDVETVVFPAGSFDEISLSYTNGVSPRWTDTELRYIIGKSGEAAAVVADGYALGPYSNYIVLDVGEAKKLDVFRSSAASSVTVYTFGSSVVRNPATAAAVNQGLQDTTEARKIIEAQNK